MKKLYIHKPLKFQSAVLAKAATATLLKAMMKSVTTTVRKKQVDDIVALIQAGDLAPTISVNTSPGGVLSQMDKSKGLATLQAATQLGIKEVPVYLFVVDKMGHILKPSMLKVLPLNFEQYPDKEATAIKWAEYNWYQYQNATGKALVIRDIVDEKFDIDNKTKFGLKLTKTGIQLVDASDTSFKVLTTQPRLRNLLKLSVPLRTCPVKEVHPKYDVKQSRVRKELESPVQPSAVPTSVTINPKAPKSLLPDLNKKFESLTLSYAREVRMRGEGSRVARQLQKELAVVKQQILDATPTNTAVTPVPTKPSTPKPPKEVASPVQPIPAGQVVGEKQPSTLKLKRGNVQLEKPLRFTKDENFGTYSIVHPKVKPGEQVEGKNITIKGGKIVGMTPTLAKYLGVKTLGEKQGETVLERKRRLEEEAKVQFAKDFANSPSAFAVRYLSITDRYAEGKITEGQRDAEIAQMKKDWDKVKVQSPVQPIDDQEDGDAQPITQVRQPALRPNVAPLLNDQDGDDDDDDYDTSHLHGNLDDYDIDNDGLDPTTELFGHHDEFDDFDHDSYSSLNVITAADFTGSLRHLGTEYRKFLTTDVYAMQASISAASAGNDNEKVVRHLVKHLAQAGFKPIVLLGTSSDAQEPHQVVQIDSLVLDPCATSISHNQLKAYPYAQFKGMWNSVSSVRTDAVQRISQHKQAPLSVKR